MPKKKKVSYLEKLCIKKLATIISKADRTSSFHFEKYLLKFYRTRKLQNILPPLPFQRLFDVLSSRKGLNSWNSDWFFAQDFEQINYVTLPETLIQYIISQKIQVQILNLKRCCFLSTIDLKALIINLPSIVSLNISKTNCNNDVLTTIFETCDKLTHLDVSYTCITQTAFLNLCKENRLPITNHLHTFNLFNNEIRINGLVTLGNYFVNLHFIKYSIYNIWDCFRDPSAFPTDFFNNAVFGDLTYSQLSLFNSVHPFMRKTMLIVSCERDLPEYRFKCLLHLSFDISVSFTEEDVIEILKLCQHKIKSLELSGYKINVYELAKYCTEVEEIKLNFKILTLIENISFSHQPFENVVSLTLSSMLENNSENMDSLKYILLSCIKLGYLHLESAGNISNKDLFGIIKGNRWLCLKILKLHKMNYINWKFLKHLLSLNSVPLNYIEIKECINLPKKYSDICHQRANKNNLNVKIKFV